jgi:hypothetical protein
MDGSGGTRGSTVDGGAMLQAGRKVADSNPDEIIGVFNVLNPSYRIMVLEKTQPLTEMNTGNLPGGGGGVKRGRRVRLIISLPYVRRLSRK